MKRAVQILAGLQVVGLALVAIATSNGGSDPAGQAMSEGLLLIGGLVLAVFLLPALLMASSPRLEKLALLLVMMPLALVVVFADMLF